MAESYNFGKKAEIIAEKYLLENGYKILDKNWRYSRLEVDIVAQKDIFLIIVEVKARKNTHLNFEEVVTLKKQKNLITAAEKYLEEKDIDLEIRFDVIFIYPKSKSFEIEHIENAFYATLD